MGHASDEFAYCFCREFCVRVEGNNVADVGRRLRRSAVDSDIAGIPCTPQQPVEFVKFAALPLPPHPLFFTLVPEPFAVENKEACFPAGGGSMTDIELFDPPGCKAEEFRVARYCFGVSVRPVGQKGKADVAVRVSQVMRFEVLDLLFRIDFADEKGRHRYNGAQRGGNSVGKFKPGQMARPDLRRHDHIYQHDRNIRCGEKRQHAEQ